MDLSEEYESIKQQKKFIMLIQEFFCKSTQENQLQTLKNF